MAKQRHSRPRYALSEAGFCGGMVCHARSQVSLTHSSLSSRVCRIPAAMPSQYYPYLSRLSAIARSSRSKNSCMISRSSISFLLRVHGALTLYTDKTIAGMSTIMENFVFFPTPSRQCSYSIPYLPAYVKYGLPFRWLLRARQPTPEKESPLQQQMKDSP